MDKEIEIVGELSSWSVEGDGDQSGWIHYDIIIDKKFNFYAHDELVTDESFDGKTKEEFEKAVKESNKVWQKEHNRHCQFTVDWF